jgi:hypothetical protein
MTGTSGEREMNDRNNETKTVYAVTERNGKSFWTKVGVAFTNADHSITLQLDALPVSGRLQIREGDERRERG